MKYPEVSKRFNYILTQKGMKQQELADLTGINKASISQYMNGEHSPSKENARLIGKALNVNPLYLMDLSDNMNEDIVTSRLFNIIQNLSSDSLNTLYEFAEYLKSKESSVKDISIYQRIKEKRIALGYTQDQLAQLMGYSDKGMISRIESGQVDISYSKIVEFAKILHTTPTELISIDLE